MGEKEFECPVYGGWCRRTPVPLQNLQDSVSANRLVATPNQFQHAPAHRSQEGASPFAQRRRRRHGVRDATRVIVRGGWKRCEMCHEDARVCFTSACQTGIYVISYISVLLLSTRLPGSADLVTETKNKDNIFIGRCESPSMRWPES